MQGIVLDIDLKTDSGIIRGDDQHRYEFNLADCHDGNPLGGSTVDFEIENGKAISVYVLKAPLKASFDWLFWFLFSFRGRISRDHLLAFLMGSLVLLPVPAACAAWSGMSIFGDVGAILFLYIVFAVLIKRFHDSGTSAGWLFFMLAFMLFVLSLVYRVLNLAFIGTTAMYVLVSLAALTFVFCLYLCFAGGAIGENRYGKQPRSCKTARFK